MATFDLGQVIRGKYRIESVLGRGGMGLVVAAHHIALDQRVAIKFLLPTMLAHPEVVGRFAREARAASKIKSDHVARVMDVDALEDGTPFIVMEYLEGGDLSIVRKQGRPLAVSVAAGYVVDACEAIGEAHRLGIVHRDIKPANLFVAQRGGGKTRIKVLDFGISKMAAADASEPGVTGMTSVMGSAEYMSPEQMRSVRDVDPRADIWALGVTLYELVTARVPFPGETMTQVCALVMSHNPPPPSTMWGGIPAAFDAVVLRCLEKDRNRRYGSAAELAAALAPFAALSSNPAPPLPSFDRISSASVTSPLSGDTISLGANAGGALGGGTLPLAPPPDLTPPSSTQGTVLGGHGLSTTGAITNRFPRSTPTVPRARLAVAAVVVFVTLVGGVSVFFLKHPVARPADSSTIVLPSAPTVLDESAPTVLDERATTASDPMPSASILAPPAEPSAAPIGSASSSPSSAPVASATAPAKVTNPPRDRLIRAKPDCNLPFTVDAKGVKHAKPECL